MGTTGSSWRECSGARRASAGRLGPSARDRPHPSPGFLQLSWVPAPWGYSASASCHFAWRAATHTHRSPPFLGWSFLEASWARRGQETQGIRNRRRLCHTREGPLQPQNLPPRGITKGIPGEWPGNPVTSYHKGWNASGYDFFPR